MTTELEQRVTDAAHDPKRELALAELLRGVLTQELDARGYGKPGTEPAPIPLDARAKLRRMVQRFATEHPEASVTTR